MAFLESSLPLLSGPFINSFIIICVSILSGSQDELLLLIGRSAQFIWGFWLGDGRRSKVIPSPLGKKILNAINRQNSGVPAEAFRYGILIANTIRHISISLTFVEYHKARPHERSSYWSIIYSWCILSCISYVRYSHLSYVLFSKQATSLILNCFRTTKVKFLE
jgi:hypothetical protein